MVVTFDGIPGVTLMDILAPLRRAWGPKGVILVDDLVSHKETLLLTRREGEYLSFSVLPLPPGEALQSGTVGLKKIGGERFDPHPTHEIYSRSVKSVALSRGRMSRGHAVLIVLRR